MLAILTTHPIQYQVPLWQLLAQRAHVPFEVWYLCNHGVQPSLDREFGQVFQWDLDMLAGYPHRFLTLPGGPATLADLRRARLGALAPLFREKNVHALWINGWQVPAYWEAAFQARVAGVSVLLRGESNDLARSAWYKRLPRQLLLGTLFNTISRFLYIGTANKRLYQAFGVPARKLIFTPYGVDNARFAQAAQALAPERAAIRAAWNIPADAHCFLFCGKFIPKKHPLDILDALAAVLDADPAARAHLLMVGDGELRPVLEARAHALATRAGRPLVTFAGFLNQTAIPRAYTAADTLVLASDTGETWGLVVNEALACGVPAIVSDQCGCAEDLAAPLDPAYIFPCGDVRALADCLRARLKDYDHAADATRARALVARYDLQVTAAAVENL